MIYSMEDLHTIRCGECFHFRKKGFLSKDKGMCNLYKQNVRSNDICKKRIFEAQKIINKYKEELQQKIVIPGTLEEAEVVHDSKNQ